jgi:hypothetical protein
MRAIVSIVVATFVLVGASASNSDAAATADAGVEGGARSHCDALAARLALPPDPRGALCGD